MSVFFSFIELDSSLSSMIPKLLCGSETCRTWISFYSTQAYMQSHRDVTYITSVKIMKVGMTPYQKLRYKKPLQGMVESMQQSYATPKNRDVGRGLRKIVACSQPYLAVHGFLYLQFCHGVIPTSYFDFSTYFTHFPLTVSISTTYRGVSRGVFAPPSGSRSLIIHCLI